MQTPAERVIAKFGGIRPLADALGYTPSTVQGWGERGVIPARQIPKVIAAGRSAGVPVTVEECLDIPAEPQPEPVDA